MTSPVHPARSVQDAGALPGEGGPPRARSGAVTRSASMVALDVDGTLLRYDSTMSAKVRRAVRQVAASGVHVVISTGRAVAGAMPVIEYLGLGSGYAVCSNGSITVRIDPAEPSGYRIVDSVTFDPEPALRLLRGQVPDALIAVEEVGVGFKVSAPFPEGELTGRLRVVTWEELVAHPATRVTFRSPDATAEEFAEMVQRIGLRGVNYAVGFTAWLDITPDGVSKGSALEQVRGWLGVDPADTTAVGDQRNDLEMLSWAARGVAMGNAPQEVKAVADEVARDVEEDGVVAVLASLLR